MQGELPGRSVSPLRVGLLLDSLEQPRWAHVLVQGLQRSAAVEIAAVFLGSTAPSGSHAAENRLSHLGYRLYRQLDRWKFLGQTDALQRSDITELIRPWTPHPQNPVRSDVRAARPAGWLFERDGRLYRPAQDCSVCYGHALAINEIRRLDTERYEEVEVKRILPRAHLGEMGIHTVNQAGDLIVFDRYAPEVKSGRLP